MLHNVFEVRGREAHLDVMPRLFDLEIEGFWWKTTLPGRWPSAATWWVLNLRRFAWISPFAASA